jgi:hypothetical protein
VGSCIGLRTIHKTPGYVERPDLLGRGSWDAEASTSTSEARFSSCPIATRLRFCRRIHTTAVAFSLGPPKCRKTFGSQVNSPQGTGSNWRVSELRDTFSLRGVAVRRVAIVLVATLLGSCAQGDTSGGSPPTPGRTPDKTSDQTAPGMLVARVTRRCCFTEGSIFFIVVRDRGGRAIFERAEYPPSGERLVVRVSVPRSGGNSGLTSGVEIPVT